MRRPSLNPITATYAWGAVIIAAFVVHAFVTIPAVGWMFLSAVQWLTLVWLVAASWS